MIVSCAATDSEFVKSRRVGTRAPGATCLTRVPRHEKCELYAH